MKYYKLTNSDTKLSEFGFGASPFGDIFTNTVSDNDAKQCIDLALDHGITYFDVAPYYGKGLAETRLAQALGKLSTQVFLSTKVGRYDLNQFDFSPEKIKQSITNSLKLFNRNDLDIVYCHDIEFVPMSLIINSALPTLKSLQKQGLIKHIGISGLPLETLYQCASQVPLDIILTYTHHTLIDQTLKDYEAKFKNSNVDIINASPFAMGLLTTNNCPTWHPAPKQIQEQISNFGVTLKAQGISLEKSAFQYALSYSMPKSHLIGISSLSELKTCLHWYNEKKDTALINDIKNKLMTMLSSKETP